MKKILFLFLLFYSIIGYCQDVKFDSILINPNELPSEFKTTKELECQSIQAKLFYNSPEIYNFILGKLTNKQFQTFEYEGNSGSILYFEFDKESKESKGFIEGLLWGGKKPTKLHPENIFTKGNFLIITSFPFKSKINEILTEIISKK